MSADVSMVRNRARWRLVLAVACAAGAGLVASLTPIVGEIGSATSTSLSPVCGAPDVPSVQQHVVYDPDPVNSLETTIWPAQTGDGPRPVVVIIQGNSFNQVQPLDPVFGGALACAARFLASEGFVVFAPGYRGADITWPTPGLVDMQGFVRWLREPAQVAAHHIDVDHVGALGTSAGGLFAGLLGSSTADPASRVQAVVTWSGPLDLTDEPIEPPSVVFSGPAPGNVLQEVYEVQQELLGCEPYVPGPGDTWTPVPTCLNGPAAEASAFGQVGPNTAPILMANARWEGVLVGTGDCVTSGAFVPFPNGCFGIPIGEASAMFAKTQAAGIPSQLDEITDSTVVEECAPMPAALSTMHVDYAFCIEQVWDDTQAWFETYLEPSAPVPPAPVPALPTFTG